MVDHNDLEYRINRMKDVADKWGLTLIEPLIAEYKIPSKLLRRINCCCFTLCCEIFEHT